MIAARIHGFTRELAKEQPEYHGLCIKDEIVEVAGERCYAMVSAWEPTTQELAALIAGGKVHLRILGIRHPPIALWVEPFTEPAAEVEAAR